MKFRLLIFLLLVLSCANRVARAQGESIALTHATVIDGTGARSQTDITLLITGGRIAAMGRSATLHPPRDATVVDATGKYVIPGLWDMHVHWYAKPYLPLFIANGVTGVRMMMGLPLHHEWRKEIEAGTLLGPRLYIASAIVDGPKPVWPGSLTAANAAEGRQAVVKAKAAGADFVKVYSLLPRDAFFALADEAGKQGLPFEGHVPICVTAAEAAAAGQKSFEHLTGIMSGCSTEEAGLLQSAQAAFAGLLATNDPMTTLAELRGQGRRTLETYSSTRAAALFALLKSHQTWQCPTLTVLRNMRFRDDPSITNDARLKYLPPDIKLAWDPSRDFRSFTRTSNETVIARQTCQKELEIVGAMQRAGVGLLAGTDTLNPYCLPGFSLHDELGLLVKAGLTPMQALQTATRNPARFMGREHDLGTVEKGKLADLLLLDANPLADISNTRKLYAVIYRGRLFPRAELDQMLSQAESLASQTRPPISTLLAQTLQQQGLEAALGQYRDLKAGQPTAYDFGEEQLNNLGYELLGRKKFKEAVEVLKLNVEAYPKSANVYDSLGEAYLNAGDHANALENYRKSLELDPANTGAAEKLKDLQKKAVEGK